MGERKAEEEARVEGRGREARPHRRGHWHAVRVTANDEASAVDYDSGLAVHFDRRGRARCQCGLVGAGDGGRGLGTGDGDREFRTRTTGKALA
jgi:hypothetical protein